MCVAASLFLLSESVLLEMTFSTVDFAPGFAGGSDVRCLCSVSPDFVLLETTVLDCC